MINVEPDSTKKRFSINLAIGVALWFLAILLHQTLLAWAMTQAQNFGLQLPGLTKLMWSVPVWLIPLLAIPICLIGMRLHGVWRTIILIGFPAFITFAILLSVDMTLTKLGKGLLL